ncbi:MAG: FCD domain-containing protein [Acidobacteriaceae bacterium]|nr:FCD domain-containing protein [Acidobacteriaceae bacterium]
MTVRLALEGATVADTARNATEEHIAELKTLLERMENNLGNTAKYEALDMEFHIKIAEASSNVLLFEMVSLIRGQLSQGVHQALLLPKAVPLSQKEHRAILNAIAKRQPEEAKRAMEGHLLAALTRYRKEKAQLS